MTSAGLCSALALPGPLALVGSLSGYTLPSKRQTLKPVNGPNINKYVALGDSYSAGNLAGKSILSSINGHDCITDNTSPGFHFDFLACSDFTTPQISASEITDPSFINGVDLYTITSGGNDVGFTRIVLACVYNPSDRVNLESPPPNPSSTATASKTTSKPSTRRSNKKPRRVPLPPASSSPCPTSASSTPPPAPPPASSAAAPPVDISTLKALNDLTDQLNLALRTAAIAAGIQFLDSDYLQRAFNGHRFCESALGTDLWF